jgi:CheY-like chemotaxis protein
MTTKGEILIVDDDPDFCEIAKVALEANSFAVRCACSGPQGLALMRERKPDLVFLDVIMILPDEGVTVSEEMARDPELRDIPVVMISSVSQSEYTGHFPTDRPLHVHMFLDKPVSLHKLLDTANDFVQQQEASV